MSVDKVIDFLFVRYDSFEEFRQKIGRAKIEEQVEPFLEYLSNSLVEEDYRTRLRELGSSKPHSYFFPNLLLLYHWLLSHGYRYFSAEQIECLFKLLDLVRVPDHVIRHYPWAIVFLTREGMRTDEKFWEQTILPHIDTLSRHQHSLSGRVSLWLTYHCGLKQLFPENRGQKKGPYKISGLMEKILIRYINLVDVCPELEDIFGVAIEKDMYRIYRGLAWENHE